MSQLQTTCECLMRLRRRWILTQRSQRGTSCWLPVMMTPPPPELLLQSGPAGANWGWSRRWHELFSSGIPRTSPWVWGRPVASQPWTRSHLSLRCPGRERKTRERQGCQSNHRCHLYFLWILNFLRRLASGSIYAPSSLEEGGEAESGLTALMSSCSPVELQASQGDTWGRKEAHTPDWEWEQLVSKNLIDYYLVARGLIWTIIKHDRNTCSARTLNNNY